MAISQYPVDDLLQGHVNPEIRQFVNRYLRPLQERTEDIKGEMEGGKLTRMKLQDETTIYRLNTQIEGTEGRLRDVSIMEKSLTNAKESVARSLHETNILQGLHFRSSNLKQATRFFNHFLTAVMEGQIAPGSEKFADFLIDRAAELPLSEDHAKMIKLYIQVQYGDPKTPRNIPFSLAKEFTSYGLFGGEVALLTENAEKKTRQERAEFKEKYIKEEWDRVKRFYNDDYWERERVKIDVYRLAHRQNSSSLLNESIFQETTCDSRNLGEFRKIWLPDIVYVLFVWLLAYPALWELVSPYTRARFVSGSKWAGLVHDIDRLIYRVCWSFNPEFKSSWTVDYDSCGGCPYGCRHKVNCRNYVRFVDNSTKGYDGYLKDSVVKKLKKFLREYKEGAFVILGLMYTAHRSWWGSGGAPPLPDIEGKDPIEVLHLIKKLNDFMQSNLNYDVFLEYFVWARKLSIFDKWKYQPSKEEFLRRLRGDESSLDGGFTLEAKQIEVPSETDMHECVRFLKTTVTNRWGWYDYLPDPSLWPLIDNLTTITNWWERFKINYIAAPSQWKQADDLTRSYFLTHACFIVCNGLDAPPNTPKLETVLIDLLKDAEARLVEEKQREKDAELMKMRREKEQEERERIERRCAEEIAKISYAPPDSLNLRVIKDDELEKLKKACLNKLSESQKAKEALMVIDDFVKFCILLNKPENHIKKPTGQYAAKEIPLRTVADMVNEMRGELTDLPNFTAYAKIMQVKPTFQPMLKLGSIPYFLPEKNTFALKGGTEYPVKDGTQTVAKHKINTPIWYELPGKWPGDVAAQIQQEILEQTHREYCQSREIIEKQIREKQAVWQKDTGEKPLSGRRFRGKMAR